MIKVIWGKVTLKRGVSLSETYSVISMTLLLVTAFRQLE